MELEVSLDGKVLFLLMQELSMTIWMGGSVGADEVLKLLCLFEENWVVIEGNLKEQEEILASYGVGCGDCIWSIYSTNGRILNECTMIGIEMKN